MFKAFAIVIVLATGQVMGPLVSRDTFETKAACEAWVKEKQPTATEQIAEQLGEKVELVINCEEQKQ